MKIFKAESLLFKLPDDFDGGLADIFDLLANYTREKGDSKFTDIRQREEDNSTYEELMDWFNYKLIDHGSRVDAKYVLIDMDEENCDYTARFRDVKFDHRFEE